MYNKMSYKIDTQIQTATVFLDSTNCVSRSPYFKYDLATPIKCPTACRLLISVIGASLPNVIYNITEANNKLSFQILTSQGTSVIIYTITFPVGIYSAWTFAEYINAQPPPASSIKCVYNEKTFKFSFVSVYRFQVYNSPPDAGTYRPTTCGGIIGADKDENNKYIYPIVYSESPAYTVIMPSTVNFIPTPYVFVKINGLSLSNINSRGEINDTLVRFPVNCEYGQMIQYRPIETNRFLITRQSINNFMLRLEDVHNNPLAIPSGVELQLILKIEFIFPPEQLSYEVGTISHFFKENPITEVAIDDEDEQDGL